MASRTMEDDLARLREEFDDLRSRLLDQSDSARDSASRSLRDGAKALRESYGDARDSASQTIANVTRQSRDGLATLEHRVEERPLTSLLVAFGIGLVVGRLL
jgi:ElaB/YqjD/DUF883 family membrane-anchored ribosome-binding protein